VSLAFSASVGAATLKIATLAPAGTTWMKEMKSGAKQIKQRTEGRVKLKFYPGGVMGNDQSVHRKIKIGQLQGGAFTPGGLAQVNTAIQVLGLPMMFDTNAEIDYVRARMDPIIRQEMEASGFVILGISDGGFVRIMSRQPMRDLESIRASKVWIPEGDKVGQIVFQALGITPIALPISDVFTGLQTGLIETVAVNPTSAIAFQWYTSASYMTETPISYIIGVLAVQKKAFDKLSTADQAVVREEIAKVFSRLDVLNRSDNLAAKAALKQQGIIFVTPDPEEVERWKSISDGAIDEMVASGIISAEIVSQVREHLQSFRSSQ
jgi:TRAP-type C4-dicarboxylate transport system substrate-binding protein